MAKRGSQSDVESELDVAKPAKTPMTKLAEAAFREAALDVMERAIQTGTKVIIGEKGRILKLSPYNWRFTNERKRLAKRRKRNGGIRRINLL